MDKPDKRDCPNRALSSGRQGGGNGPGGSLERVNERETPPVPTATKGQLFRDVALYSGARLLLVIVISAVIIGVGLLVGVEVPVLVAAVFGVLISLPLSLVLFKSLRIRVNESIAGVDEERRRACADLQAKLRGEDEK